jgi:hypothetical protein
VTRHKEPLKGLLVQSLVACAAEGLVRVDVTAGDGTKVKANASMAANADAEQLGLEIGELEALLEAEVAAWIEQAAAADAAEDALLGGGDDGPPVRGGTPAAAVRRRTAGKLARRRAAQAKLQAQEQARQEQAEARRQDKIARLAARKERLEARAAAELARAQAKVDRHVAREAAAAAGAGKRPPGQVPAPAEQQRDARAAAAAAARAAGKLEEALACPNQRARTWRPPLPSARRGPDGAERHAGLLELDAQPSAAGIRLPGGAARKVSAPVRRAHIPDTCAAPGPNQEPGKDPDPRRRSSRGSGGSEQACLPGNGGYATPAACPASTTSWRYGLRRTCRLVTGRSHRPPSTWPDQPRLTLLAVTHRCKQTHCLWLEQFQIADYALRVHGGFAVLKRYRIAGSDAVLVSIGA